MKIKTLTLEKNNKKQFNKELNKGQSIVAIVAPDWCGHCKEMMPDWEEINNEYDNMDVLEDALIGTITDKNMGLSNCSKILLGTLLLLLIILSIILLIKEYPFV